VTHSGSTQPPLAFRGGAAGALAPLAVFLAGVAWLAAQGAPDERGFWPVLVAALIAGLTLTRDRARYADTIVTGMAQPVVLLMIVAWLLSGVLSSLLTATGFVQALSFTARALDLGGGWYAGAAFLACALVSTSTGTSFGTILLCGPLLYPAGAAVGVNPAVLLGAILGGATFGDSISPISDTTIASAGTQGADIGGTVRARLKYVLPAGLLAFAVAVAFGQGEVVGSGAAAAIEGGARGLPMAIVPLLVLGLLLAQRHLVEALLFGVAAAIVLALPLGLLRVDQVLSVTPGSLTATSVVIDGLERGVGVSVFTLLLVGLVAALDASGVVARATAWSESGSGRITWVEARIVAMLSVAVVLTTHSVVAILTVGPYVAAGAGRRGVPAYRRANLLDLTACTWPFLLPFFLPTILAASASASGTAAGLPRLSPLDAGLWNVYSWGLVLMLALAVGAGYGRDEGASRADYETGAK
jgi:Na+/H+ antiporter NhaC